MPSADTLAQALAASPVLPSALERLNALLDAEAQARVRFLDDLDPSTKAEFINGEVVLHSPARFAHLEVTGLIYTLLSAFVRRHGLGAVTVEKALVSLTRNDYEPDVAFFGRAKADALTPDTLRLPAPDLAVEVLSESTEARDRGVKMEDYALHGVAEYWIVDADARVVEQYALGDEGAYELRMKSPSGTLESPAVEGFAVPVAALFDARANLAALRTLIG